MDCQNSAGYNDDSTVSVIRPLSSKLQIREIFAEILHRV